MARAIDILTGEFPIALAPLPKTRNTLDPLSLNGNVMANVVTDKDACRDMSA